MKNSFSTEFVFQVFSLIIFIIIVHAIYVGVIRPNAAAVIEEQRIMIEEDPDYVPERSGFVIVKDLEQEACFILMLWAMSIMGYKTYYSNRERSLLDRDLVSIAEGVRILPEDGRQYARQLQALPDVEQRLLLPRALLSALQRFGTTRNVQDVSSSTHTLVTSEADRLESEFRV